jgi:hypothetical protein
MLSLCRKLSKGYHPDQQWLKLAFQFITLLDLISSTNISNKKVSWVHSSGTSWVKEDVVTIDIETWNSFERFISSFINKDSSCDEFRKILCRSSSYYLKEFLLPSNLNTSVFHCLSYEKWQRFVTLVNSSHYNIILKNIHSRVKGSGDDSPYTPHGDRREGNKDDFFVEKYQQGKEALKKSNDYVSFVFSLIQQWISQIVLDGSLYFSNHQSSSASATFEISPSIVLAKTDFFQYYKLFVYRERLLRSFLLQRTDKITIPYNLFSAFFERNPKKLLEFQEATSRNECIMLCLDSLQRNLCNSACTGSPVPHLKKQLLERNLASKEKYEEILNLIISFHHANNFHCRSLLAFVLPLVSIGCYSLAIKIVEKAKEPELPNDSTSSPTSTFSCSSPKGGREASALNGITNLHFTDIPLETFNYLLPISGDLLSYESDIKNALENCRKHLFSVSMDGSGMKEAASREADLSASLTIYHITPIHFAIYDGEMEFLETFLSYFPDVIIDFPQLFEFIEINNCYCNWKPFIKILLRSARLHHSYHSSFFSHYYQDYQFQEMRLELLKQQSFHQHLVTSNRYLRRNPFLKSKSYGVSNKRETFYNDLELYLKTKDSLLATLLFDVSAASTDFPLSKAGHYDYTVDKSSLVINSSYSNESAAAVSFLAMDGTSFTSEAICLNAINLLRCLPQSNEITGLGSFSDSVLSTLAHAGSFDIIDELVSSSGRFDKEVALTAVLPNKHGRTVVFQYLANGKYKSVDDIFKKIFSFPKILNESFTASPDVSRISLEKKLVSLSPIKSSPVRAASSQLTNSSNDNVPPALVLLTSLISRNYWHRIDAVTSFSLFQQYYSLQSRYSYDLFSSLNLSHLLQPSTPSGSKTGSNSELPYVELKNIIHTSFLSSVAASSSASFSHSSSSPRSENLLHLFSITLQYCKYMWKLIIHHNFLRFIQFSSSSPFNKLDSLIRAKQILSVLNIPFSYLFSNINNDTIIDQLTSASSSNLAGASSRHPSQAPSSGIVGTAGYDAQNRKKVESQFLFDPFSFHLRISQTVYSQLKFLVSGFYQLRINENKDCSKSSYRTGSLPVPSSFPDEEMNGVNEKKEHLDKSKKAVKKLKDIHNKSMLDSILLFHFPFLSCLSLGTSDLNVDDYLLKPPTSSEITASYLTAGNHLSETRSLLRIIQLELSSSSSSSSGHPLFSSDTDDMESISKIKTGILSSFSNYSTSSSVSSTGLTNKIGNLSLSRPNVMSDPRSLMEALQSAYLIIEFARCLCFCKLLSIITSDIDPASQSLSKLAEEEEMTSSAKGVSKNVSVEHQKKPNISESPMPVPKLFSLSAKNVLSPERRKQISAPVLASSSLRISQENLLVLSETSLRFQYHPYTLYEKRLYDMKFQLYIINDVMKQKQPDNGKNYGLNEKLRLCDYITANELRSFFKFHSYYSARFNHLREIICNGLAALMIDLKKNSFCELICRLALSSGSNMDSGYSNTVGEALLPFPPDSFGIKDSSGKLKMGNTLDDKTENFQEMLGLLQSFKLKDFWIPYILEDKMNKPTTVQDFATFLSRFSSYAYPSSSVNSQWLSSLRDGKLLTISFEEEIKIISLLTKAATSGVEGMKGSQARTEQIIFETIHSLNSSFRIGSLLYWMLTSIYGLLTQSKVKNSMSSSISQLYDKDLLLCQKRQNNSFPPLIALCLGFLSKHDGVIDITQKKKISLRGQQSSRELLMKECCQYIMNNFSMKFYEKDCYGRSPLEISALTGNYVLLQLFLSTSPEGSQDFNSVKLSEYRHLLWHVLFECPASTKYSNSTCLSTSLHVSYYRCIELLLNYSFPYDSPLNSPLSCIDVMILKQIPVSIVERFLSIFEKDFSNRSFRSDERFVNRFRDHWFSLSLLSLVNNPAYETLNRIYLFQDVPAFANHSSVDSVSSQLLEKLPTRDSSSVFAKLMALTVQALSSSESKSDRNEMNSSLLERKVYSFMDVFSNVDFFNQITDHCTYFVHITHTSSTVDSSAQHIAVINELLLTHYSCLNALITCVELYLFLYQSKCHYSLLCDYTEVERYEKMNNVQKIKVKKRVKQEKPVFCVIQRDLTTVVRLLRNLKSCETIGAMTKLLETFRKDNDQHDQMISTYHQQNQLKTIYSPTTSASSLLQVISSVDTSFVSVLVLRDKWTLLELSTISNDPTSFEFHFHRVFPLLVERKDPVAESDETKGVVVFLQRLLLLMAEYRCELVFQKFMELFWKVFETSEIQKQGPKDENDQGSGEKTSFFHFWLRLITNTPLSTLCFSPDSILSPLSPSLLLLHFVLFQRPLQSSFISFFLFYTMITQEFLHNLIFSANFPEESVLIVLNYLFKTNQNNESVRFTLDAEEEQEYVCPAESQVLNEFMAEKYDYSQNIFHILCRYGYEKLIKFCVENSLHLDLLQQKDDFGSFPIEYSINSGHSSVTRLLKQYCPYIMRKGVDDITYFFRIVLLSRSQTGYQNKKVRLRNKFGKK